MTDPLRSVSTLATPQTQRPVDRPDMVQNNAGGYGFQVDDWQRLRRFLVLGTEGGTYYVSERKHTFDNVGVVSRLANNPETGPQLVREIIDVSLAGRAPRQQPTLFALAVACASKDLTTRRMALDAITKVCRTGTHLFTFANYVQNQRGWGRGLRSGIASWYEDKDVDQLAYQAVKYRQREGWTHRDLLRLSHPDATGDTARKSLFDWICGHEQRLAVPIDVVEGYGYINRPGISPQAAAKAISQYNLPWEAVPSDLLADPVVWEALLPNMPITALIRNLARLTRLKLIAPFSDTTKYVVGKLGDGELLKKGRIHPIQCLDALLTYSSGHGARGQDTWNPVSAITSALDEAFYKSFGAVEPAGKNTLLALDVSASMEWYPVAGSAVLTPRTAAAAMSLVTAATEPSYHICAFSGQMVPVDISPRQRLDDVVSATSRLRAGSTDCALPILYALSEGLPVDTFVIYTDNETWYGRVHPFQALREYRQRTGIDAKVVVCGMTSTGFTVADPSDPGMLDVVGFDTATPNLISAFSKGGV